MKCPDIDPLTAELALIRDEVRAFAVEHEKENHGGKPCMIARADLIGFLAYALGLGAAEMHAADVRREFLQTRYRQFGQGEDNENNMENSSG